MSDIYDKVVKALAENARRTEVVRAMEEGGSDGARDVVRRRVKLHPMDWAALKEELGTSSEDGKLWTPGARLLGTDILGDETVPTGEVLFETIIWEWM